MIRREFTSAEEIKVSVFDDGEKDTALVLAFGELKILIEGDVADLCSRIERVFIERRLEKAGLRECSRCEDEVQTLSSDDLCDGCVEELATTTVCPNCGERVSNGEMNYVGTTSEMCDGCDHNARRSGWDGPGSE